MAEKIYLGMVRLDYGDDVAGERIWLDKHSWDCDWYWSFGYVGNGHLHAHFKDIFITSECVVTKIFEQNKKGNIDQKSWWILRDLFIQAYALAEAAAVYRFGGHNIYHDDTRIILDPKMTLRLNADLEVVLDKIWDILLAIRKPKGA